MGVASLLVDSEYERVPAMNPPVQFRKTAKHTPQRRAATTGFGHWIAALVDQALVSGTRFLTTIIIGRYCGAADLGTYSLAFSLLILGGCFQEAIVTTPYAVLGQRLRRRSRTT